MIERYYTLCILIFALGHLSHPEVAASSSSSSSSNAYVNVYGNTLESCSENNMALTGYTRSGSCVEYQDDQGSHHICIDVSSASGGSFCTVTGQSDWCSTYMTCDTNNYNNEGSYYEDDEEDAKEDDNDNDDNSNTCPVGNWCVCQWAFASYLQNAGGCDYIQDIKCNAINMEALIAYSKVAGGSNDYDGKYTNALRCLESRCGVTARKFSFTSRNNATARRQILGLASVLVGGILCFAYFIVSKRVNPIHSIGSGIENSESSSYHNIA